MRTVPTATAPLALLAALLLALAGSAAADELEPNASGDTTGKHFWVNTATVVSVDPGASTLTIDEPEGRFTYAVDEGTLIRKGGHTIALDALEEGDRVALSGHGGAKPDDPPVADTVQVVVIDPETGEPVRRGASGGGSRAGD